MAPQFMHFARSLHRTVPLSFGMVLERNSDYERDPNTSRLCRWSTPHHMPSSIAAGAPCQALLLHLVMRQGRRLGQLGRMLSLVANAGASSLTVVDCRRPL